MARKDKTLAKAQEDAVIDARRKANLARPSYRRLTLNRKKIGRAMRTAGQRLVRPPAAQF